MSAFKNLFGGGNDQQNEELIEESGDHDESDGKGFMTESVESVKKGYLNLKWKERLVGFIICIVIAGIFVVIGCAVASASSTAFGVLFSIGTIAAIASTLFLVGPIAQAKKFVDFTKIPEAVIRIIAAVTVILAIILAIVCGAYKQTALAILLAIVQFVALIVYSITLMPLAMTAIVKGFKLLFASVSSS